MLHHAHNLCNEAEPIVNEVTLQNNALLHMCIILKMLTKLFLHINIRRKIKIRKRKISVIPYVFQMLEDCYTCYGKKFKGRSKPHFLRKKELYNNFCSMTYPRNRQRNLMYATSYLVQTILTVTLEKHHSGGMNKKKYHKRCIKTKMTTILPGSI